MIDVNDKSKVTVTRVMDSVKEGLPEELKRIYTKAELLSKLKLLKNAKPSERSTREDELLNMFDICGIKYNKEDGYLEYERIINAIPEPTRESLNERLTNALFKRYKKCLSPSEYMLKIVNNCCNEDKAGTKEWGSDTLRLRILKQFIKYGNFLRDAGYGGKSAIIKYVEIKIQENIKNDNIEAVVEKIDDNVFNLLETGDKDSLKYNGKFGLIKAADDLAGGKFRAEGATKKLLYMFAMAYNMTYYYGSTRKNASYNCNRDIETNLFTDYYCNNLMRFVTEAYKNNLAQFEIDPSGRGINYKNYAEVVCLYYISREGMEAWEKIKKSSDLIENLKNQSGPVAITRECVTQEFKRCINVGDVFYKDENMFIKFLIERYELNTNQGSYSIGTMQIQEEQNSAYRTFCEIIDKMRKLDLQKILNEENYDICCCDELLYSNTGVVDGDKQEFLDLLIVLQKFVRQICSEFKKDIPENIKENVRKDKNNQFLDPKKITRTRLLVAIYYCFNEEMKYEGESMSFKEVYNSFATTANDYLEKAGYPLINPKNILDIMIIFSSYAYLHF